MTTFDEAVIYGKLTFGKDFDHCSETDDGWVAWFLKSLPGVAVESQTWDEFDSMWKKFYENTPQVNKLMGKKDSKRGKRL